MDAGWGQAKLILVLTLGGACGVNARYWLGVAVARWLGAKFPWGTLLINVSGSFAIGLVGMILAERRWGEPYVRVGLVTGFLGGYTTFSAYMFESVALWGRGERRLAAANLLGSVALGLAAVLLGMALGRALAAPADASPAHEARVDRRVGALGEAIAGGEPPDGPTG